MKRLLLLLLVLPQFVNAKELEKSKLAYEKLHWFFDASAKQNEVVTHLASFIKINEFEDIEQFQLTLEMLDESVTENIVLIKLQDVKNLTEDEKTYQNKGYHYKALIPVDKEKYKGWQLSHNFNKNAIKMTFSLIPVTIKPKLAPKTPPKRGK